jgi:hypothetical protein
MSDKERFGNVKRKCWEDNCRGEWDIICREVDEFDPPLKRPPPECPDWYSWHPRYKKCVPACEQAKADYDPVLDTCVCVDPGMTFVKEEKRCVKRVFCPDDQYWEPKAKRCIGLEHQCEPGYWYNPATEDCESDDDYNPCPDGQEWSNRARDCVSVCDTGFWWNPFTRMCEKEDDDERMSDPDNDEPMPDPADSSCPRGGTWDDFAQECRHCPEGQYWDNLHKMCLPNGTTYDDLSYNTPVTILPPRDDPVFPMPIIPEDDDDDDVFTTRPATIPPPAPLTQYTPSYRNTDVGGAQDLTLATTVSQAHALVDSQDPDGIKWISAASWLPWNGVPITLTGMTPSQMCAALFPTGPYTMLGLRDYFYEINPFLDNANPTPAEIDNWNIHVIKHLRKITGINIPIEPDKCLFLRAQWGAERRWTTTWDTKYPGNGSDGVFGPCQTGDVGFGVEHCGATFVPDASDQALYGQTGTLCTAGAGSEGLNTVKTDLPWSIKLSNVINKFVCAEGNTGHAGPFFERTKVGFAFMVFDGALGGGSQSEYRGKWR